MEDLTNQHHEQLENFNQSLEEHTIWQSGDDTGRVAEARIRAVYGFEQGFDINFEILARRYNNLGGMALKVCFWDHSEQKRSYLGAIGYHSLDAAPYCRLAQPTYDEPQLYTVLETVTFDANIADYRLVQAGMAVAV